ncbi:MAG: sugar phosphate isomerase/epimerase family protein [Oscillospiraceae bacterium]
MKHGIYYAYWEHEWAGDYLYYADKVARLGFDILEISGLPLVDYSEGQISELRSAAERNGIMLTAGFGPTFELNVGSSDMKIRHNALEWFKSLFEVLEKLNIKQLGGGLYSYWPVDFTLPNNKAEDWKYSVEGTKLLAELAQNYDVRLDMEVLNRFENHLLNTAEEGLAFVKEVDMPNVKVMLDTFHMNIEEVSLGAAIRKAGSYLGHLHTGECNRDVPGRGRMPWREIGEALRDIGYDGTVVMEPFVQTGGSIGKNIHVWRDISRGASEEVLDERAREALVFQRYMLDGK